MSLQEELLAGERMTQTQPCQEISGISWRQLSRSEIDVFSEADLTA